MADNLPTVTVAWSTYTVVHHVGDWITFDLANKAQISGRLTAIEGRRFAVENVAGVLWYRHDPDGTFHHAS